MSEARNGLGTGLTFLEVADMIHKEMEYAKGWGKGSRKISKVEGIEDQDVHSGTAGPAGQPYGIADFMTFAQKYWDEITLASSGFTPDGGAIRIRIIKVIALLSRALMIYGRPSDLERLAGVSSSQFPILGGGLKTFDHLSSAEGCLIPTADTKGLRNESPNCDPLK